MKGTLYVQRDSQAIAGKVGKAQMATEPMSRSRVESIAANGLFISGLVKGHLRGQPTIRYQEWWFVPIIAEREG